MRLVKRKKLIRRAHGKAKNKGKKKIEICNIL
jgi:hypothetical protein